MKFVSHALCLALCLVCVSCGGGGGVEGTFDFKPDKTLVSQTVLAGKKQSMSGTWELDEDKVTVRAKKEGGKEQVMSGTGDGDKITMSENGTDSFIVLKRQ